MGKPVAFEANALERLTRGFISITTIRPVLRIDGELDVRPARLHADLPHHGDRGVAHPLIFLVGQRLRRGHGDRIARVNAHRVKVLDRADDDAIVVLVAHHLQLTRHIRGPLLVIWDGLPAHRSRLVRDHILGLRGRIHLEYLPAYAPELNPVEYIWSYWKQHELANVCPKDYWQLNDVARNALRRMRRRPLLITAFWKQSSLYLE